MRPLRDCQLKQHAKQERGYKQSALSKPSSQYSITMSLRCQLTPRAFCCADIPCYFSPELSLSKVNAVDVIFCCLALFVQPGLQLISDISISSYSSASIAENPLLPAGIFIIVFWFCFTEVDFFSFHVFKRANEFF